MVDAHDIDQHLAQERLCGKDCDILRCVGSYYCIHGELSNTCNLSCRLTKEWDVSRTIAQRATHCMSFRTFQASGDCLRRVSQTSASFLWSAGVFWP